MSAKSSIEWTDATWNPTSGCTKVSPGCKHCYAETIARRFPGKYYPDGKYVPWTVKAQRETPFTAVMLHPERLDWPLHQRKPQRIFVDSMSDLFHEDVPDEFIEQVFDMIWEADRHTFQILTKRAERMRDFLLARPYLKMEIFFRHCWLGVSVENQRYADERIPLLLQTPAAVRFLSCEPLLGPVELLPYLHCDLCTYPLQNGELVSDDLCEACGGADQQPRLSWVIAGGESGPKARPMHPDWVRSLRDQCQAAGVPFFFKQWGEWGLMMDLDNRGVEYPGNTPFLMIDRSGATWEHGLYIPFKGIDGVAYGMKKVGKAKAGALLDGVEHREFPEVAAAT